MSASRRNISNDTHLYLVAKTVEVLELWDLYKTLFWGSKEDFQFLIDLGSGFFDVIQTLLQHDIILRISKLFDDHNSTASFPIVLRDSEMPDSIRKAALASIRRLKSDHRAVFQFRHNLIAHSNAKVALGGSNPPHLQTSDLGKCLDAIQVLAGELLGTNIETIRRDSTLSHRAEEFLANLRDRCGKQDR